MEVEEAKTRYFIDLAWYQDSNRSLPALAASRMCDSCREKLGTEVEERVATTDSKTGKVVFELRRLPFAHDIFAHLRDCCGNRKGYITSSMPVMEAIFRLFLMNGNQPLDVDEIRQHLEWTDFAEKIRYIGPETVERLLSGDRFYGFRQFQPPELDP